VVTEDTRRPTRRTDRDDHGSAERRRRRQPVARGTHLDVPMRPHRTLADMRPDPEFIGRFSERFARFMGTARFLVGMTIVIIAWVVWNTALPSTLHFDRYPFIFLTLMLSLQASYAAPLILLAQNRQEARDRVQYNSDRDVQLRTRADMEFLAREVASLRSSIGEVATRDYLRSELRSILAEIDARLPDRDDATGSGSDVPAPASGSSARAGRP
jgi:uncharacterized membrane protein